MRQNGVSVMCVIDNVRSETISRGAIGRYLTLVALAMSMTGCAGFIPMDAPDAAAVSSHAALVTEPTAPLPYALMPINAAILHATNSVTDTPATSFAGLPGGNYRD